MTLGVARVVAVALGGAVAVFGAAALAGAGGPPGLDLPFRDGPPARVTGGFGEDSCFACHWGETENDSQGWLQVVGFPQEYGSGTVYRLDVTLTRPGMMVGGFQLSVRLKDGGFQAGELQVPQNEEGRIGVLRDREVQFAHHLLPGIELSAPDTVRWTLDWVAPEVEASGPILLHASAVAGDGDESQIGDAVYTLGLEARGDEGTPEGR